MNNHVIIVDEQDRPIGIKPRGELLYSDIYRVSALWLSDTKSGDMLIAQRKWTKRNDPGKWGPAVSGTVDEGESYEQSIQKETAEELGLTGLKFEMSSKQYVDDGEHKFFCQWFHAQIDRNTAPITIQQEEVEAVKWVNKIELLHDVHTRPQIYTTSAQDSMKILELSKS